MQSGIAVLVLVFASTGMIAQVHLSTVRPSAVGGLGTLAVGTLTLSATPATVSFTLVSGGIANGSTAVNVNTSWNLLLGTSVNVFAFFNTPTAALSGPGNIPSSRVLGQVPGGVPTAFTPFTQTNVLGPAGGSLHLVSVTILPISLIGSRAASLSLRIDLTGASPIPAGTYTGTLVVQAQAL